MVNRIAGQLVVSFGYLGGISLISLCAVVSTDVLVRMITSRSIVGASETASVFLVFLVFLGLGYTQRQDGHVSMEAVQSRLSPRTQAVSRVLTLLICFCMSVLLIYGTAGEAWNSYVTGEYQFGTVRYPFWPMKFGITWGFILLALQQLVDLARAIQALRHHAPPLVVAEPGA